LPALLGFGNRLQRELIGVGCQRSIDVGAIGQGFAPEAHGAARIEPLRLAERGDRRGMVEAIGETHALVEIALRLRTGGCDREVDLAEAVIEPNSGRRCGLCNEGRGHGDPVVHGGSFGPAAAHCRNRPRRIEQSQLLGGEFIRGADAEQPGRYQGQ
jgi:hypothetical protein